MFQRLIEQLFMHMSEPGNRCSAELALYKLMWFVVGFCTCCLSKINASNRIAMIAAVWCCVHPRSIGKHSCTYFAHNLNRSSCWWWVFHIGNPYRHWENVVQKNRHWIYNFCFNSSWNERSQLCQPSKFSRSLGSWQSIFQTYDLSAPKRVANFGFQIRTVTWSRAPYWPVCQVGFRTSYHQP